MSSETAPPNSSDPSPTSGPGRRRYVPAVGDRLRKLLAVVFGLFALLTVNSAYLLGVRVLEWARGQTYQNWFYMVSFLAHLVLGVLLVLPVVIFGLFHMKNARHRPNRRAVYVGYTLFFVALILLASGIVLMRLEGVIVVKDPTVRGIAYWAHVATPVLAAWLFVLHRLAGKKIQWRTGRRWAMVAAGFAGLMVIIQAQDPRSWNVKGPASGEKYFFPSLARTATGDFIPERVMLDDQYCARCHEDSHRTWSASAHRFSSFNNPAYNFSVLETRKVALARDGTIQASRWCAGCHDPAVFFTGKFDDPNFDTKQPAGQAGITCMSCHAITHVNSLKGNADYTIEQPIHYPFAFSDSADLRWVNEQLIKAKPDFHKKTFLKPLHKTTEFCGACHKVHLPPELNHYKWLRGQNHPDSFLLSGVSGYGVASFYYPDKAKENCASCHMQLLPSDQFAARDFEGSGGERKMHDHQFPSANTALAALVGLPDGLPDWVNERHAAFNEGVMRVDLFGVREGGTVDGALTAPLRPQVPALERGRTYLIETVVRTVKMGHHFTQGTADSNEVWLDVTATTSGAAAVVGRSGGRAADGEVDPWSHFVNVYMLDRNGNRIDRRNAQDIFTPLYNHQIPPGAADVVHYSLTVPRDAGPTLTVDVALQYRKFDTTYMQHVFGAEHVNALPILTLATDRVTFPIAGAVAAGGGETGTAANPESPIPEWQRWNDYGIGLLLKGGKSKGELRQAEEAFRRVEALGRPDGPLNLARVYLAQGTVEDKAIAALERAAAFDPPAPRWVVAWFTGLVNKQNGFLDEAIANFESIVQLDDAETRQRGFDFSKDWRVWDELGQTLFERSKQERGEARKAAREALLRRAEASFLKALERDPEDLPAHYNLDLVYKQLGETEKARKHFDLYRTYKPDDNARDHVIAEHRRKNPAADHAAEAIVIYDLNRDGAYGLTTPTMASSLNASSAGPPPAAASPGAAPAVAAAPVATAPASR